MKIKLEITASPELLEAIKIIFGGMAMAASKTATESSAPAKRASGKNSTKAPEKEEALEEVAPVAEEKEETGSPITIETVRAAVQTKAQGGKRDQVKTLLTKYEVTRVTELPDTKYAQFLEEVNAL